MIAHPATRRPRSVESLHATIREALDTRGGDLPLERLMDLFGSLADRHDTDLNSPYNMGYFCIDADAGSLAALQETDRRAANIAVGGQHPAAVAFEHHSIEVILRQFGIDPRRGHGHYTSCGTEANMTAMLVALADLMSYRRLEPVHYDRNLCLDEEGCVERYEYFRHGILPLKARPAVYVSAQTHPSIEKNARNLIGSTSVRRVPQNRDLQMDPAALERMIVADRASGRFIPFLVAGTVGATETGIIDPLPEIGRLCRKHRLWFHVDAPWGGIAAFSRRLKRICLKGSEYFDSITFDPHKTMVPLGAGGTGMFLSPHREAVERAFNFTGQRVQTYDYAMMSLQGSRVNNGLRVLSQLIEPMKLEKRVEHEAALGERLRRRLRRQGWTITSKTPLPIVCALHPAMRKGRITAAALVRRLAAEGVLAKAATLRPGEPPSLRLGIISRRTTERDIDVLVELLARLMK